MISLVKLLELFLRLRIDVNGRGFDDLPTIGNPRNWFTSDKPSPSLAGLRKKRNMVAPHEEST
jgi:hypothetical protein